MKRFQWTLLFIGILSLSAFRPVNTIDSSEELKKLLCKGWKYEKCRIMGTEYLPKPAEANDRFRFFEDMTFEIVEEGSKKKGSWKVINVEEQIISLEFEEGVTKQLKIEQVNEDQLVYALMADWEYNVTVYMQAAQQLPSVQAHTFKLTGDSDSQNISLHSLLLGGN